MGIQLGACSFKYAQKHWVELVDHMQTTRRPVTLALAGVPVGLFVPLDADVAFREKSTYVPHSPAPTAKPRAKRKGKTLKYSVGELTRRIEGAHGPCPYPDWQSLEARTWYYEHGKKMGLIPAHFLPPK